MPIVSAKPIGRRRPWNRSTAGIGVAYWCGTELLLLLFGRLTASPSPLDRNILARLAEMRTEFGDVFFRTISWGGSLYLLLPATAGAIRWMVQHGRTADAWRLGLSLAGTVAGVYLAKVLWAKPRPNFFPLLIPEPPSFSFPSAHAAQIAAVVAAACFIRPRHGSRRWWLLSIGAGVLLTGAVGVSRMYLQAHYPSDVVGGAAYAVCWVLVLESLLRNSTGRREKGGIADSM